MNRRILWGLGILLILPSASAWFETFEDDTSGQDPTSPEYTLTETIADGSPTMEVSSSGRYTISSNAVSLHHGIAHFDFATDGQFDSISFLVELEEGQAGPLSGAQICTVGIYNQEHGPGNSLGFAEAVGGIGTFASPEDWMVLYTSGTPIDTDIPASGGSGAQNVVMNFNWAQKTFDVSFNGVWFNGTPFGDPTSTGIHGIYVRGHDTASSAVAMECSIDNITVDGTIPDLPEQVASLAATVNDGAGSEVTATLAFPVSPNDPDQSNGEFNYEGLLDGGLGPVVTQPTTSSVADGIVTQTYTLTGIGPFGPFSFEVRGTNAAGDGPWSCQIDLDMDQEGGTDTCGTNPPPPPAGGGVGDGGVVGEATFPGVDLQTVADDVGISIAAMGWLIGVLLICAMAGVFAFVSKTPSPGMGILGGFLGLGLSVAFSLIPVWFVVLLVLVAAAIIFFTRR